jgi:hypothetical protein
VTAAQIIAGQLSDASPIGAPRFVTSATEQLFANQTPLGDRP